MVHPVMQSEITGRGSPVVLVPGGLTGWVSWTPHAERLSADFTVLRVQLLSVEYGLQSSPLPPGYGVGTESRALELTLDAHNIEAADFSGWSYGALVLLDFALNHPDRLRSLTLTEPPAFWVLQSRRPLDPAALEFQRFLLSIDPVDVTAEQLARFAQLAGLVPQGIDPRTSPQWSVWYAHRNSLRTGDVAFRHRGEVGRLRAFPRPVLLFKGVGSPGYLREIVDILADELPDARLEELSGAHALPLASIDRYLELFIEFVRAGPMPHWQVRLP